MNAPKPIDGKDLGAFVDNELDEATRAEVAAWIDDHPEDAERAEAYRAQTAGLHRLFDPVLDELVPERLTAAASPKASVGKPKTWIRMAAAIALFVAGAAAGWGLRGFGTETSQTATALPAKAVSAHVVYVSEVRHPVEVGVDEEVHLVKWLSKRMGHPVRAPRLDRAGYQLIGGRLLHDQGDAACQFMYEDAGGNRLTLYVRPARDDEDTAFRFVADRGVSAFYWVDAPLAYAVTGKMPRDNLLAISRAVYDQFQEKPRS